MTDQSQPTPQYEVWNISADPPHHARDVGFASRKEAYGWMAQFCSHVGDKYEVREGASATDKGEQS